MLVGAGIGPLLSWWEEIDDTGQIQGRSDEPGKVNPES